MSNSQIVAGGSPSPALSTVVTDQATIRGSGTQYDPLHVAGGNLAVTLTSQIGATHRGAPMVGVSAAPAEGTVISVTRGSGIGTQGEATILGLALTSSTDPAPFRIQTTGIVTLTTAEWDLVAGTTGGLVPGEAYFADAVGQMADVAPGTPGNWSSQIGVALSATQMQLGLPSVPIVVA